MPMRVGVQPVSALPYLLRRWYVPLPYILTSSPAARSARPAVQTTFVNGGRRAPLGRGEANLHDGRSPDPYDGFLSDWVPAFFSQRLPLRHPLQPILRLAHDF